MKLLEERILKDGIVTIKDGDFIKAKDTTLGADNGIAVAYALALLADDKILEINGESTKGINIDAEANKPATTLLIVFFAFSNILISI